MKKIGVTSLAFFAPLLVSAQGFGEVGTFVEDISEFIQSTLIPLLFGVALLVFLWGIFYYFILGGGDDTKREEGKKLMVYSIAGFVVMVSIFGIVNMIAGGLGFSDDEQIENIPNVPQTNT